MFGFTFIHLWSPNLTTGLGWFTLWTMKSDHGRWPLSMVRLHEKLVLRALDPSIGVNQIWTKKNDHAPKSEGADFFNTCPKTAILRTNSSLTILLSTPGLTLSSLLVKCVKDVACKSSHNNFYKKNERFNLYTWHVIYMWHVPCVVTTLNRIFSVWLYLMFLLPYLAQH